MFVLGSHPALSEDCPLRAPLHTPLYPAQRVSHIHSTQEATQTLTTLNLVRAISTVHRVVTLRVLSAHALTVLTGEGIPWAAAWEQRTKLRAWNRHSVKMCELLAYLWGQRQD